MSSELSHILDLLGVSLCVCQLTSHSIPCISWKLEVGCKGFRIQNSGLILESISHHSVISLHVPPTLKKSFYSSRALCFISTSILCIFRSSNMKIFPSILLFKICPSSLSVHSSACPAIPPRSHCSVVPQHLVHLYLTCCHYLFDYSVDMKSKDHESKCVEKYHFLYFSLTDLSQFFLLYYVKV